MRYGYVAKAVSPLRSVQVVVSLVAPGVDPGPHKVVLVLSSLVPVHWDVRAPGLHGDVSVYVRTSCPVFVCVHRYLSPKCLSEKL